MAAMEKNNKNLNVPNLRFPEFSGEWEKCSLNDISTIYGRIGFRGYTVADIVEKGEGAIALSPTNIDSNCLTYEKDNTYISTYKYEESPEIKIFAGDIIFVKTGSTVGKVAFVDNIIDRTTLNPQLVVLKQVKCNPYFLYLLMAAPCFQKHIKRITVGGAVPTLSQNEMGRIGITLPPNAEQDRISALFKLLNYRIETQKKIIEKYESLIRGLYHSVFNQPASTLQLKDVVSVVKGLQVNGEELLEYGKYYVMNGGTEPSGYLNVYNTPANTISISEGGNSCGYVQYNTEPFWSGGHCYSLIQKGQSVNYQYLYHFLKYKERNIMALRIGSGLPNIQKKDLERFEIRVLPTKQQNRVAEILEDMSAKCNLEKRILQGWQCQKSHLLRYIFI